MLFKFSYKKPITQITKSNYSIKFIISPLTAEYKIGRVKGIAKMRGLFTVDVNNQRKLKCFFLYTFDSFSSISSMTYRFFNSVK